MANIEYNDQKLIEETLNRYYQEELKKHTSFLNTDQLNDEEINNLQIELLRLSQHFVDSFDYEISKGITVKSKIKTFIKKIIRKSTRFMMKPYADKIRVYQEMTGQVLGQIANILIKNNSMVQKNKEEIAAKVEIQLQAQKRTYEQMQEQIQEYFGKTWNHEEAIFNLTKEFNKTVLTVEQLSSIVGREKDKLNTSYSQAGEDVIVSFILENIDNTKKGSSYLDIGCNNYKVLNNTYHLYEMGMRGVLVDANPQFIDEIKSHRPQDTVLNLGIGKSSKDKMTFYVLNGDGLSSFNKSTIDDAMKRTKWLKIEKEIEVPVITINELIENNFYTTPTIISLDVEGDELAILKSMDIKKYRPLIFIIETIEYREKLSFDNKREDIIIYLESKGYKEYAFTGVNSIFIDKDIVEKE